MPAGFVLQGPLVEHFSRTLRWTHPHDKKMKSQ
jgi:hypothetical protein